MSEPAVAFFQVNQPIPEFGHAQPGDLIMYRPQHLDSPLILQREIPVEKAALLSKLDLFEYMGANPSSSPSSSASDPRRRAWRARQHLRVVP